MNLVSFVFPCFNESHRLETTLSKLQKFIAAYPEQYEYIFVDDGSTDNTAAILNDFAKLESNAGCVKVVQCAQNGGKGAALRSGVNAATGNWVLTLDADLAAHPNVLVFWKEHFGLDLNQQDTVYIGSREKGIQYKLVRYSVARRIIGVAFNTLQRMLTGLTLDDTQCGFKLYPTALAQEVFSQLEDVGFAHDVEVLMRLKNKGVEVKSLPLKWKEVPGSKVSVVRDSIKMMRSIIKISKRLN